MESYELTKKDYSNIEKLLNVESKIVEIYKALQNLEDANKKDSREYFEVLSKIIFYRNKENELYQELAGTPEKTSTIYFYLFEFVEYKLNDCLISYIIMSDQELIKLRIKNRLEKILSEFSLEEYRDSYNFENIIEDDENEVEEDSILPNLEELGRQHHYSERLSFETERDLLNTVLVILSEYLINPEYKNIYQLLIKFKYQLSFLFSPIELDFLNNNFEINPNLYWGANMVIDENNSDKEDLELARDSYAEEILYSQAENFRRLLSEDLKLLENYGNAIISQVIVRAAILFAKKETKEDYSNYLITEIYYSKTSNTDMIEIIRNSINKYDADKLLPSILRLKLD